jgi:hypothetical protein
MIRIVLVALLLAIPPVMASDARSVQALYWREGDALMARIEGTRGGQPLSDQWRFRKSGTDPASSCDYRRTPGDSSASPDARHAR